MIAILMRTRVRCQRQVRPGRRGFTLIDLIVAMGIVLVLMSLVMTVVPKMRQAANKASTTAIITALQGAVSTYYQNFRAYPGPISDETICGASGGAAWPIDGSANKPMTGITMSENLVLGLAGGLICKVDSPAVQIYFARELVGPGPRMLASISSSQKAMASFYGANDRITSALPPSHANWGLVLGNTLQPLNTDTRVPEYLDTFSDPMPILYYRAHRNAKLVATDAGNVLGQFDARQNPAYLNVNLGNAKGTGHGLTAAGTYVDPGSRGKGYCYNLTTFMASPDDPSQPRVRDTFVLIAAGVDRIYGTDDDIVSFGNVAP